MGENHYLSRRAVLRDLGRGTVAVALLGTGMVACSSDGDAETSAESTAEPDVTTDPAPSAQPTAEPTPEPEPAPEDEAAALDPVAWERVSFGFVSAYVLARDNEVAIIDTGTSGSADRFSEAFAALGLTFDDVAHVVLTHLHGDHVGGLGEVLGAAPTATAYAGEADVAGIDSPRPLTPVDDGDEIFGLNIIGTPGHTAGHVAVLDPVGGVLVAGDALNTGAGAVLGPNPDFTADMTAANESARRLGDLAFDTLLVGHGEPVIGMADDLVADLVAGL